MTALVANQELPSSESEQDATHPGDGDSDFVGDRRSPLRRCIVTGVVQNREALIRFVVGPDNTIVPDVEGSLPGRGYWVVADRAALEKAIAKGSFSRAARRSVQVPPDLVDRVEALLERHCLDLIGLARRAGQAVAGFEKVRSALQRGQVGVLLAAADGAADGRGKLQALAGTLPVVVAFDAIRLGATLGREQAVHAALAPGALAARFLAESRRFAGIRQYRDCQVGVVPTGLPTQRTS
ncbi:MAG: RNA-binding protein [Azospirillaceae bacterium]|nr:RNA-binding protein [Azospirillaceae bacterium]